MQKKIIGTALLIMYILFANAQVYNTHNFYTQNLFYYSPAHTGDKGQMAAFIDYRNDLNQIENATTSASVGLHSPVTKHMSIGGLIKTERLGLLETLSGRLDYSFRTKIIGKHIIAFGINAGALQRSINSDLAIVEDPTDPLLTGDYFRKNIFFTGASINYNFKKFEFDIGIPVMYKTNTADNFFYANYWSFISYSLLSKNKDWEFKPSVSVNYGSEKLIGYHANLLINYKNIFWVQPTYKVNRSIVVSAGVNLKKIGIGYSYETNSGALSTIGGASHEIIITYGFFKPRKHKVDTIVKDAEYYHNLKQKIGDKTYEEYVSSNNYGFYNSILDLTDSIHQEEVKKIEKLKNKTFQQDSIAKLEQKRLLDLEQKRLAELEQKRLDSLNQAKLARIEKAKRDSARAHHLRHLSEKEMNILKMGVHFKLGSAMLDQEGRNYLNKVAELIKNNDNIKILVSGHTCDLGSEKANLKYSIDRAETVIYYLKSKGVNPNKISSDYKLDAEPIVPNTSENNRSKNRRVSFSIIKE